MNESKLNLVVPKDYNGTPIEVVLREGKAAEPLPIREPLSVEITGTIDAPLRWLEKKISLIDQKQAHIQVDRYNMSITLIDRETDYYTNTITGQLSPSKEMTDFGIKCYSGHRTQQGGERQPDGQLLAGGRFQPSEVLQDEHPPLQRIRAGRNRGRDIRRGGRAQRRPHACLRRSRREHRGMQEPADRRPD